MNPLGAHPDPDRIARETRRSPRLSANLSSDFVAHARTVAAFVCGTRPVTLGDIHAVASNAIGSLPRPDLRAPAAAPITSPTPIEQVRVLELGAAHRHQSRQSTAPCIDAAGIGVASLKVPVTVTVTRHHARLVRISAASASP